MKTIIFNDLNKILKSRRFWLTIVIIIASSILNIFKTPGFDHSQKINGSNLFIFGNIQSSPIMTFIAPFLPALALNPLINDDLSNSSHLHILKRKNLQKYLSGRAVSLMIAGGGIFIIAFVIILLGCLVFGSSDNIPIYRPLGLFKEVYYSSELLYIILFILHAALFGAIYAFFGMGIALITRSESMALVFPGIFYHCVRFVAMIFDKTIISWIGILFPTLTYEFGSLDAPLWGNVLDMGIMLVLSVILITIGYKKLIKGINTKNSVEDTI